MRSKTTVFCDGLDADGNPCTSSYEVDSHKPGPARIVGGMHGHHPPGWWTANVIKVIPPRERPPQPNIFERGPLRTMMKAMAESLTPPDLERADAISEKIRRLKIAIGDVANAGHQATLAADLAVLETLIKQILSTPEKIEEQLEKMYDGLKSGYEAGADDGMPPPRDRIFPIHALLCDKHPQPAVQFDESKVPHWAGMSVCDHDNELVGVELGEIGQVDLLGGGGAAVQVATPVPPIGYGG